MAEREIIIERKRLREEEIGDHDRVVESENKIDEDLEREIEREEELDSFLAFDSCSDVEAAIHVILTRIPRDSSLSSSSPSSRRTVYPRIVFKHQLFPIIKNQTEIEEEIDKLRFENKIRSLLFPNSSIGLMISSDYVKDIESSILCLDTTQQTVSNALQRFLQWLSTSTKTSMLESDFYSPGSPLTPSDIPLIVEQGYLFPFRSSKANGLYYLSHCQIGNISHAVETMSNYILNTIKRTRYKEIYEEKLIQTIFSRSKEQNFDKELSKRVRKVPRGLSETSPTGLGWKYHLYDMLGRDMIVRVETGGMKGPVLRLSQKMKQK